MAEYNRLVSEHNFFNDGLEKGMKKRKKRKFNRNSKRNAERKYDNRNDNEIYKIKKGRNNFFEKKIYKNYFITDIFNRNNFYIFLRL